MSVPTFDDLAEFYEAMIAWPKRLANEEPFYRRLFDEIGVRSVLDAACGTGRHAAMFHAWGLRVEGADISPSMIERARASFPQKEGLRWVVRGFHEPAGAAESFDAAVCVGNSLALAPDRATAQTAIGRMLDAVRPGGAIVLHVLNLWRLPDGPCVWQKCRRATLSAGDVMIVKGVHRCTSQGYMELVVVDAAEGTMLRTESVPFLGLEAGELEQMAASAGANTAECFGSYDRKPYDRTESVDLIVVARK